MHITDIAMGILIVIYYTVPSSYLILLSLHHHSNKTLPIVAFQTFKYNSTMCICYQHSQGETVK